MATDQDPKYVCKDCGTTSRYDPKQRWAASDQCVDCAEDLAR